MSITTEVRNDLLSLVVGAFQAAPGTTLLNSLADQYIAKPNLAAIALTMQGTAEFIAAYPRFLSNQEFAARVVDNILEGRVTAAERQWAIDTMVADLNKGAGRAELILSAVIELQKTTNPAWANAKNAFINQVEVAKFHTVDLGKDGTLAERKAIIADVDQTASSVTTAKAVVNAPVIKTFALTAGLDSGAAFTGGAGNDTFSAIDTGAATTTINTGDSLVGGAGTDRLSISTSGAATGGAIVATTGVEELALFNNSTAGYTVNASQMAGLTDVYVTGGASAATISGGNSVPNLHLISTNQNATVTPAATAVAGLTDAAIILSNGSATTLDVTATYNGLETVNLVIAGVTGSATKALTVASDKLSTLNITGQGAWVAAALPGASATITGTVTSDAGDHRVNLTPVAATSKLSVNMGAGNDVVTIGSISALHTIAGGEGTDTLVTTTAISAATGINISGFEAVRIAGGVAVALPATNTVATLTIADAAGGTLTGLTSGGTVNLTTGGNATVSNAAWVAGTADSVTINVGSATATGVLAASAVTATGIETATINNLALSNDTSARTVGVTDANLKTITVNGAGAVTVTGGGIALTKVDASAVAGAVTFNTTVAAAGAELIGGAGNDAITGGTGNDTLTGGAGNDTITGGRGVDVMTGGAGADIFVFAANATGAIVSTAFALDTIKDFVSGTDKLSITNITAGPTKFLGNFTNFAIANAAALADTTAGIAFFVSGENTLYVQAVAGTVGANDFAVKLEGVSTIAEADLLLGAVGGRSIALTAAVTSVTVGTTATSTTSFNDTITGTIALVEGITTLVGGVGTDSVTLSNAGTFASPVAFNSIETLNLSSAGANTVTLQAATNNGALQNINGGSQADAVTVTNIVTGGRISLGDGADTLTAMTTAIATTAGASFDGGANATATLDLVTFAAAQTFTAATLDKFSNFESFDFGAVANAQHAITLPTTNSIATVTATFGTAANVLTLTGTSAQIDALTSITQVGDFAGGITLKVSDAASLTFAATDTLASSATADANISVTLGNFTNVVNIDASKIGVVNTGAATLGVIAGGTGADTINISGTNLTTTTQLNFITGFESINITGTGNFSATPVVGALVTGTTNISASSVAGTATITIDGSAGTTAKAVNITGGGLATSSNVLTGGAGADTLTGGLGADTLTGGAGADKLNLGGGAVGVIIANATSTGVAVPLAISTAIPVVGTVFSTVSLDIVTGFTTGNTIAITTAADSTTAVTYNLIRNGGTLGAGTTNNAALITGNYDSATNTFTVSNTGTSSLFAYDTDGILNVSNTYAGIVLVGYVDAGAPDTYIAAGTTGATFSAVG